MPWLATLSGLARVASTASASPGQPGADDSLVYAILISEWNLD